MGRQVRSLIGEPSASGEDEGGERLAIPLRVKVFHRYGSPDIVVPDSPWLETQITPDFPPLPVTEENASPRDRLSVPYLGSAPNVGTVGP